MTVEVDTSRVSYTGAGTTGPFTIPFYFLANADIRAIKVTIADGAEAELALTTDFTLTGAGDEDGGELTLVSSLSSSYKLVIFRDPEVLQESAYPRNDRFPSSTHEEVVDRLTMIAQRHADLLERSVRMAEGDTSGDSMVLPAAVDRVSKYLAFDANGDIAAANGSDGTSGALGVALAASSGSSLVGFVQSGTGAVSRDMQSKGREVISLLDFIPTNLHAGISARTDTSDLSTYIQAAEDAASTLRGTRIFGPHGLYHCNDVVMKSYVVIDGEWVGQMNGGAAGLTSTHPSLASSKGTTFVQYAAGDVFITDDYPTLTFGCGLRNVSVIGKSGFTTGRGIYISHGVTWGTVENVAVCRMAEQGVVMGGIANTLRHSFLGWNAYQGASSFTFYKGQLEVYGTDQYIEANEIHGISDTSTYDGATLGNASLYAVACLAQTSSSKFTGNIFEIADAGLVMISKHTGSTGASGREDPYWPISTHGNIVEGNRADRIFGHGIWLVSTNSTNGPYFNTFNDNRILSCGRNADNTYDGIFEDAVGANYPYSNTYVGNTVFNSDGASNKVRYGINTSESDALQTVAQKNVVSGNRVDSGSVSTASYNGPSGYQQGVVRVQEGVRFPATQISSSDVNTLDDYEEGTFTPTLDFATPGDLAVTYTLQIGRYTKIGNRVTVHVVCTASVFTHTTASGDFLIRGLPFNSINVTSLNQVGACSMEGWTKANYTNTVAYSTTNSAVVRIEVSGSGQTVATLGSGDVPTGSVKRVRLTLSYETAT